MIREHIVRAAHAGYELRDNGAGAEDGMPTLFGHFALFNRWAEIDSWFEGHFLERIAPGAFKKTIRENRDRIRALFQHGFDPQVGNKPLGEISELREDDTGVYYEVPLLDTEYVRELLPALERGLYGASFRFEVIREDRNEEPGTSDANPQGIPERTITELRLFEFGPVTFPAYAEATAGVRSLTDIFVFDQIARDPSRVRELLRIEDTSVRTAPSIPEAGTATSESERRAEDSDRPALARDDFTSLIERSAQDHEEERWTAES